MTQKEKNDILKWAAAQSDEKLIDEYYGSLLDCLGSQAERMEELGYEEIDIRERRKIEKFNDERNSMIGSLCEQRGYDLWKPEEPFITKEYARERFELVKKILCYNFKNLPSEAREALRDLKSYFEQGNV